ncbi:MAG: hypothetical protein IJ634_05575 [Bacteroidales bacterium]|nr:hypothetical protein [Bacteroidales bacterium]
MVKYRNDVHLGQEIKRVLKEKRIPVAEFARRICCHRKNVYDIFTRKSLDIDRIIMISELLDYDFIRNCYIEQNDGIEFKLRLEGGKLIVVDSE